MIWKAYRLRKDWQFQKVVKDGIKVIRSGFTIRVLPLTADFIKKTRLRCDRCLFGISTPKIVAKKSVERNLRKRQIREMLINFLKSEQNPCGEKKHFHCAIIIVVRFDFLKNSFLSNQTSLIKALFYVFRTLKLSSWETTT